MPFLIGLAFSVVLTPLARLGGFAAGLVDRPESGPQGAEVVAGDPLKIHRRPVPLLGGVAVTVAALVAPSIVGAGVSPAVWGAALVALGAGMADDARPLPPWIRVQLLAASGLLLVAGGFRLGPSALLGGAAVVVLVVGCANAVNIIDGQDGLAGGLAAIASLGLAFLAGDPGRALGLALAGGLAGFLLWNRPPARIFLGNGGAYAVGGLLATLAVEVTRVDGWRGLLASSLCLGVFAFELMATVGRRVRSGAPLASGDRDHAYDLLARRLGSRAQSTLVFWGLGAVAVGAAAAVHVAPSPAPALVAAAAASAAVVGTTRLTRNRAK